MFQKNRKFFSFHSMDYKSYWLSLFIISSIIYLIPIFYKLYRLNHFSFTNGWDEPTYLSYQGAIAAKDKPGYASSYLVKFLHELGVSGGMQNFLFDLFIPFIIFILIYFSFLKYKLTIRKAGLYSFLIVFGTVLFNRANPLLELISFPNSSELITQAVENYLPLLRSPNPQISELLLAIALFKFSHSQNKLFLLLPIPFLYWSIGIPYIILIVFLELNIRLHKKTLKQIVTFYFISLILIALMFNSIMKWIIFSGHLQVDRFLIRNKHFIVSPILGWGIFILAINFFAFLKKKITKTELLNCLAVSITIFIITEFHLIAGVQLNPQGLQDTSGTLLATVLLILAIDSFPLLQHSVSLITFQIIVLLLNLKAAGFHFNRMKYQIYIGPLISDHNLNQIIKNPTNSIIDSEDLSSRLALASAKMIIPPFSYQYAFNFIIDDCSTYKDIHINAENFINNLKSSYPDSRLNNNMAILNNLKKTNVVSPNKPHCPKTTKNFSFIKSKPYDFEYFP